MAKSLSSIMSQIERLQKQAAAIQSEVITRIRKDIAQYGLTADQLFGTSAVKAAGARKASTNQAKTERAAKYGDGAGNTWGGMGKRPAWLHEALAAGKSLEDFLLAKPATAPAKSKPAKAPVKRKAAPKAAVAAKKRSATSAPTKRARRAKAAAESDAS